MTGTPWLDGFLTALAASTVATLLYQSGAWPMLASVFDALLQAGRQSDARWLWIPWLLALAVLARRGVAR